MQQIIDYAEKLEEETIITLEERWRICFRRLAAENENRMEIIVELKGLLFNLIYYQMILHSTLQEIYEESLSVVKRHRNDQLDNKWVRYLEIWVYSKMAIDPMLYCRYGSLDNMAALLQILSKYNYINSVQFEKCDCVDMIAYGNNVFYTRVTPKGTIALYENGNETTLLDGEFCGRIYFCERIGYAYMIAEDGYVSINLKDKSVSEKKEGNLLEIIGRVMIWKVDDGTLRVDYINDEGGRTAAISILIPDGNTFRVRLYPLYLIMDDNFENFMKKNGLCAEFAYIKNVSVRMIFKILLLHCFDISYVHESIYFVGELLIDIRETIFSCKLIKEKLEIIRKLLLVDALKFKRQRFKDFLEIVVDLEKRYGDEADLTVNLLGIYANIWQDYRIIKNSDISLPLFRHVAD